jgi:hypothetical protein
VRTGSLQAANSAVKIVSLQEANLVAKIVSLLAPQIHCRQLSFGSEC